MSPDLIVYDRLAKEMILLVFKVLQEQVKGTKRGWFGMSGDDGEDILLGFDIMRRLTEKRSAIEARSSKLGAEAR